MFVLRVSNNNVTILFFLFSFFFSLFTTNKLSRSEREKHRGSVFFFFGFVEDLWFDDVIYGFWVDDWFFCRVC